MESRKLVLDSTGILALLVWSLAFHSSPVAAEPADAGSEPGGLEEIVVTATRRATNIQDTSIAVTAINGADLRDLRITNPRDLTSLAPNLMVDQGLADGMTHVSIRGLASTDFSVGASSPVATYLDDVYQPYQFGISSQVFDLNRIEVLRGPQGTLFGKNATSGSLNYYSQTPTDKQEGYVEIDGGAGNFDHYSLEGALNQPITDSLAARISVRLDRRNDYVSNAFDDSNLGHSTNMNGRLQLIWTPSNTTKINLKLFGTKRRGDGPISIGHWLGGECTFPFDIYNKCVNGVAAPDSRSPQSTYSDVPIREDFSSQGVTLRIDQQMGSASLTSITGAQRGSFNLLTNDTGTGGDLFHSLQHSDTSQLSEEIRLATSDTGRMRAIVGAYASYDEVEADQGSGSTTLPAAELGFEYYQGGLDTTYSTSFAGFASITGDVSDKFSITGGLRYSHERKHANNVTALYFGFNSVTFATRDFTTADLSYPVVSSRFTLDPNFGDAIEFDNRTSSWNRVTWDLTANYKPRPDQLLYAKVATGFRSGGFPVGTTSLGVFVELKPETVTSYEIGYKSEWLAHKLRFNAALYDMEYRNMQVQTVNTNGPGLVQSNAASSRAKGIEGELEYAPTRDLHLKANLGYSQATYLNYASAAGQLAGNHLPFAPRWSSSTGATYTFPLQQNHALFLNTDWSYRSVIYFDPYNTPGIGDSSRVIGNISVGYGSQDKRWRVTAYGNNITDQIAKVFAFSLPFASPAVYAPGRLWGIQLSFEM